MSVARSSLFFICVVSSGCAYHLQDSSNNLKKQQNIETIYVQPLKNVTLKAGVENTVYNALVRTLGHHRKIKLVQSAENADAILKGTVGSAEYHSYTTTTANKLKPLETGPSDFLISTIYTALLNCSFNLEKTHVAQGAGAVVWSSSFERTKRFSANTQLGALGTTASLINESEFERAISDLAEAIGEDVHESMLSQF